MKTALLFAALIIPAHASIINLDVSGTLGPLLGGVDPLSLSGQDFTASGTFTQNPLLIGTTPDSATYSLPGTLLIAAGAFDLAGYNATLALTTPLTGPDRVVLDFSIVEFTVSPQVSASLLLPAGTLSGTGFQDFSVNVSEPTSSLSYEMIGNSAIITGDLGINGVASISGAGGSQAPEPVTSVLMAAGLLAMSLLFFIRGHRRSSAAGYSDLSAAREAKHIVRE
ncbi:MAG TPA: hypothetical protein VKR61_14630 [Bryobacteraceae bacterium]|nr:hypothetical protein [Bryobacteraceae bacterium]